MDLASQGGIDAIGRLPWPIDPELGLPGAVGVADIVGAASVVLSESALDALSRRAAGEPAEDAGSKASEEE